MKITLTLKKTELEQLLIYCKWAKQAETYYGNKEYFWKRHNNIVKQLSTPPQSEGESNKK